jgi:hypothetical protein
VESDISKLKYNARKGYAFSAHKIGDFVALAHLDYEAGKTFA